MSQLFRLVSKHIICLSFLIFSDAYAVIPVEQFPVASPGQMNPYNEAYQDALENYQQNMQMAYTLSQSQD